MTENILQLYLEVKGKYKDKSAAISVRLCNHGCGIYYLW